ncbi:hypothetical protein KCP71_18805 [Salmonella enterica subsp. enterica]|nr:hypothetical protein KCP71_18805 [Salmonella enterica subsp. enterica]
MMVCVFTHRVAASLEPDDHGFCLSHVAFCWCCLRTANKTGALLVLFLVG